jgi:hypothetical protein
MKLPFRVGFDAEPKIGLRQTWHDSQCGYSFDESVAKSRYMVTVAW